MKSRPLLLALVAASLLTAGFAADASATLRELREERQRRTRQAAPAEYAKIDAEIATRAESFLATAGQPDVACARDWAAIMTLAGQHAPAKGLLARYLAGDLSPAERFQAQMDFMMCAVKLNDGESVWQTLRSMDIPSDQAVSFGSYFGGTFHHYVFNSRGAKACLEIIARIEPMLPTGPFANDEVRKSNGWARRQLAAAKALYLSESGRRDEAVAVLDHALATLDDDVYRKDGLRGDRQRYLLMNRPAPAIAVDRSHGVFAGLEAYRGKVVMLEFTAHWCHACHAALPAIKQLYAEMRGRGFEVVALTTYYGHFAGDRARTRDMPRDEEFARMPAMLEKQGVTWPMVYIDRATMDAYGVTGIPQIMLLDKRGQIRKIDLGFSEAKMARFRTEIESLLAE